MKAESRPKEDIRKMGIWDFLFKSNSKKELIEIEIVSSKLSVAHLDHKTHIHIVKADKTILHVDDFFNASKKVLFSRFYILHDATHRPQFAPSFEEAILWFNGKKYPKNGYTSISWGTHINQQCNLCKSIIQIPIRITKVECLTIYREIPDYKEIVGWRVSEVESKLLGKGAPIKLFTHRKEHPIIKWDSPKEKFLCQKCLQSLKDTSNKS